MTKSALGISKTFFEFDRCHCACGCKVKVDGIVCKACAYNTKNNQFHRSLK